MDIPSVVYIGTVHGFCDSSCIMCPIDDFEDNKTIMSTEQFDSVTKDLVKYKDDIDEVMLVGMGEVLVDKLFEKKLKLTTSLGFKKVSFVSNASALIEKRAKDILETGVDVALFSMDGINKETFEEIRIGLSFDTVSENIRRFVEMRDAGNYKTQVHIRMVIQDGNRKEVEEFSEHWGSLLNRDNGDLVLAFPEQNWVVKDDHPRAPMQILYPKTKPCVYAMDKLTISATGGMMLCCVDNNADFFDFGNAFENDAMELFNGKLFTELRATMARGEIDTISPCKFCNGPIQRDDRSILD